MESTDPARDKMIPSRPCKSLKVVAGLRVPGKLM